MGYEKNKMIEYQDRGYGHSEKYFCADCFGDKFLKRYIHRYGNKGQCSFCKNSSGRAVERNVVPVDEIMEIISKVIHRDYKPALGWAIYDPEEERYLEAVLDPYEFVRDELNQYMECENDEVLDEIMDTLQCEDRISTKEWRTKQDETDMKEWEKFCKLVRNSALSAEQIVTECGRERASENLQEMKACMDKIYIYMRELQLIRKIRPSQKIIRCVTHIEKDFLQKYDIPVIPATLIGTAPPFLTNDNRMSEKGDMMFYGSFEEEVALKEIGVENGQLVTIGRFHTNKEIGVLDLTKFTDCELRSIFDVENSDKRSMWFFVKNFIQSISGEKDETEKDFYKPTQVFTKYVQRKTGLQGIVYHSAKFSIQEKNGIPQYRKNVVLFVENRDCLEEGDMTDKHRMQLIMEPEPKQYVYKEEQIGCQDRERIQITMLR